MAATRMVADREFVVPRGYGAVSFEAIDAALDGVALAVVDRIEFRRSAGSSTAHCASVRSPRATNQDHPTHEIHF
jgi:hypothetical protein